jgi:hypothetical protein
VVSAASRARRQLCNVSASRESLQLFLHHSREETRPNWQCRVIEVVAWAVEGPVGIANADEDIGAGQASMSGLGGIWLRTLATIDVWQRGSQCIADCGALLSLAYKGAYSPCKCNLSMASITVPP